ncbi:Uma2 family endonuclease [Nocardia cyriacigeorgica]|uniref:Uma2 family endonuclease n=1 Tax=Nocardia cyriacigeorgica TaxID=135487 RepID=UPI001895FEE6|nr:Uma2 family endonuclease [Nocardia cyriacigeorgica]MBF6086246.1 Uma2 family endonuclease [Nocardia cyriacigeorgica]MBF6091440.1 Uma2 family endonuclease [Nocardia cyriacigeorgica]MBF6394926.1 Uma2 family endonuclease [Nocardia cyriacigeorgica]MBF6400559.1 Uma2 family endonuclease [Nocardia cyriacigeorgica]
MLGPAAGAGRWTAAGLDGLPENGLRYEVLNGQLVVSPVPEPRHQVLIQRLLRVLDDAAPTTFVALGGVGILIGDDEPIPDVIVATEPIPWDARGIPVEQVQLAVEVVSASTTLQDRMVKPVLCAAAGIPTYWRFEINSFKGRLPGEELPVLFAHVLGSDNTYEQTHRVPAGEKVTFRSPFDVTIDPAALLP